MNFIFSHLKKMDWFLVASASLLTCFGLVCIYGISLNKNDFLLFEKQLIFFGAGILLVILLSFFDWRAIRESPYFILILYFFCFLSLLGLLLFASRTRGALGWYKLGFLSFDPIELAKIVLIILLAKYFSMRHVEMYRLRHIVLSGLYVFFLAILVFFQPNFGSAMILVCLWIGILAISGIKLRHFLVLCICGFLILLSAWFFFLKDYQKERIISFVAPQSDPLGTSWNQNQAKIAIGSGGVFGQGFAKGSQTQYGFLPEPHTDFIFAAIGEEFGLAGIMVLFSLIGILIWRVMKIAFESHSNFSRLFASGFAIVLATQIFIHIGMNLGIAPVIGISLPFVSYGGSGLLALYTGLGILESIKTH